ncbi:MAG: hypothetical protein AWU57_4722 [Marinobacter sp. T13-3]|nr:MAG: hypothetical protein AWU57_4722 [Marinobacter sp. T13-3]
MAYRLQFAFKVDPGAAVEHEHEHAVRVVALGQQVADTPGQGRGFATACHGGDHRVFVAGGDDVALFVGEVVREEVGVWHGGIVLGWWQWE